MLGRLLKLLALLVFGFVVFLVGAMAYAKRFGRASVQQAPDADEIDLVATFGPLEYVGTAKAFRGGAITTWFGGGSLDLTGATLAPEGATIRVQALFGGGSLVVPDSWVVQTRVIGIGGVGVQPGMAGAAPDAPVLRVEGVAVFGGWGITTAPAKAVLADLASGAAVGEGAGA